MSAASAKSIWCGNGPLILASRSTARRDLLSSCGIEAELHPADLDERAIEIADRIRGAVPAHIARRLAAEKARLVSSRLPQHHVLGADQVLVFKDRSWAKPHDRMEAALRLEALAGSHHVLVSAAAVACDGVVLYEAAEIAALRMRALSKVEIDTYLDLVGNEALTSVGGYRIEGLGRLLFDGAEADHAVILGLPLSSLLGYFRSAGLIRL
jgi:septum formation protein